MKYKQGRKIGKSAARVAAAISAAFEIPPGSLGRGAQISLSSNREATVDGCRGILEYGGELVRINTGSGVVRFRGRGLQIKSLTHTQAVIAGFIINIDFS